MKILLPVDNSPLSEHAVSFVASRASLLGENPEVTLCTTFRLLFSNRRAAWAGKNRRVLPCG